MPIHKGKFFGVGCDSILVVKLAAAMAIVYAQGMYYIEPGQQGARRVHDLMAEIERQEPS